MKPVLGLLLVMGVLAYGLYAFPILLTAVGAWSCPVCFGAFVLWLLYKTLGVVVFGFPGEPEPLLKFLRTLKQCFWGGPWHALPKSIKMVLVMIGGAPVYAVALFFLFPVIMFRVGKRQIHY